jgi:hypothetical protein
MNDARFILRRRLRRMSGRDVKESRLSGRNSKPYPSQYKAQMLSTNLLQHCVQVRKNTVADGADRRIYRMAQSRLTHFRTHFCLRGGGGKRRGQILHVEKDICHAISKPVRRQWIGGSCSVFVSSEGNFYVRHPIACMIVRPYCPGLLLYEYFK